MATHWMVKDEQRPHLTKMLLNVTISGSTGAEHAVRRPEVTVGDLISTAASARWCGTRWCGTRWRRSAKPRLISTSSSRSRSQTC
ncbi:hypothetical protein CRG98_011394 [Punica granatum]|uniref:Uncharacterized protein n=1 Tax=Punica granatum TaxID=22663 RepID=A0A2I0KI45_PUNGR|nr:hypothetical protein CRG98_011394 [Punica granatum]